MKNTLKFSMLGIALSAGVSLLAPQLSLADSGKYKEAMQVCSQKLDLALPIQKGSLSEQTRGDLRACLTAEGVTPRRHHKKFWAKIKACVAKEGVTLPAFEPGVRPSLTPAQSTAVQACKQQVIASIKAKRATAGASSSSTATN